MNFNLERGLSILKHLDKALLDDRRLISSAFFESMKEDDARSAALVFIMGRLIGKTPTNEIEVLAQTLVVKLKSKKNVIEYLSSFPAREVALTMAACRMQFARPNQSSKIKS